MSEYLKTLEEIDVVYSYEFDVTTWERYQKVPTNDYMVSLNELRSEAIKWVKKIRSDDVVGGFRSPITLTTDGEKRIAADTLIGFFNITEEDLK